MKVVTSFTLAHSIMLALATFDAVVLPTRLTESLMALSIAYVAVENLLRTRAIERHRITLSVRARARVRLFDRVADDAAAAREPGALAVFVQRRRRPRAWSTDRATSMTLEWACAAWQWERPVRAPRRTG